MSIEASFPRQEIHKDKRVIVREGSVGIWGHQVDVRVTQPNPFLIEPNEEQPIVIANGFTEGHRIFGRFARHLATEYGQTVVTFDHAHSNGDQDPLNHKANGLHEVISEVTDATSGQVTVIGHSDAGTYGTAVVHDTLFKDSPLVSGLTLAAPAGMTDMSIRKQLVGFAKEGVELFHPKNSHRLSRLARPLAHSGLYLASNLPRRYREGAAITHVHSASWLKDVSQEIPTAVIGFEDDRVIPAEEIRAAIAGYGIAYHQLPGTHASIIDDSKSQDAIYNIHMDQLSSDPYSTAS